AFAQKIKRYALAVARAQHAAGGGEIVGESICASPPAAQRRLAEAALIIGVGGDAVFRPFLCRRGKRVRIIVEAVKRQDPPRGLFLREPCKKGPCGPVLGE